MTDFWERRFGDYRLTSGLGGGEHFNTYLGEHISCNVQAVVKVLGLSNTLGGYTAGAGLQGPLVKHFLEDAQAIARLEHPHILRVIDFGVNDDGDLFLITVYAPHGTLRQHHPKGATLQLATIVDYVKQITDGLQYAHDAGAFHSDLRPETMLLGYNKEILLDFSNTIFDRIWLEMMMELDETILIHPDDDKYFYRAGGGYGSVGDQYALGVVVFDILPTHKCGGFPVLTNWVPVSLAVPSTIPSVFGLILPPQA